MAAPTALPPSRITNAYQQTDLLKVVPGSEEPINLSLPSFGDFLKDQNQTESPKTNVAQAPAMPRIIGDGLAALRASESVTRDAAMGKADPLEVAQAFSQAQTSFKTAQTIVSESVKSLKEILNMTA
jgi:flagellar hook-basal body complex protein FliE